jgi:hypothetical protein
MSSGTITQFISSFSSELSRPCDFSVDIIKPKTVGKNDDVERIISLRCESAELPGRTFSLVDQKTYGPIEQYPIQNAYNKCALTFICSGSMDEKVYFDDWMDVISYSKPSYSEAPPNPNIVKFDFSYKTNYVVDVFINQYDLTGHIVYRAVLVDAFPVDCHAIPLNWAQTNDYSKLMVTFAYRYTYGETDKNKLNSK